MDCGRLRLSIPKVAMAATDNLVHVYSIQIVYGKLQWDVLHRFSEFINLENALHDMCHFQALPPAPSKTMLRPQDSALLEERRIMLQNWIRLLCGRPDVRTSTPFLDFIEFELHTSTSKGKVFIFSSVINPPEHRHTITCGELGDNVGALELAGASLLVAHKYTLSIYRVGVSGEETKTTLIASFKPDLRSGGTIHSIAVSITTPLLFLGHTRAITVWDCHDKCCVAAFKAHYKGVRRLRVIESGEGNQVASTSDRGVSSYYNRVTSNSPVLLSGGSDGLLKLWTFGPVNEYKLWKNTDLNETGNNGNSHNCISFGQAPPVTDTSSGTQTPPSPHMLPPYTTAHQNDNRCRPTAIAAAGGGCGTTLVSEDDKGLFMPASDFTSATPHRH